MTMLVLSVHHRISGELPLSKESGSSQRGRENLNVKVDQPCGLAHYILSLILCVCINTAVQAARGDEIYQEENGDTAEVSTETQGKVGISI